MIVPFSIPPYVKVPQDFSSAATCLTRMSLRLCAHNRDRVKVQRSRQKLFWNTTVLYSALTPSELLLLSCMDQHIFKAECLGSHTTHEWPLTVSYTDITQSNGAVHFLPWSLVYLISTLIKIYFCYLKLSSVGNCWLTDKS